MNVTFGLCLDGFASADLRPSFDEVVCGPVGLLRLLELRLGLVGAFPSHGRRVVGYRDALAALAAAGPRFYSVSFAQDDYAVAETLLRWRDELVLAGWDGLAAAGFSSRLATLAAVEATLNPALRTGEGDRLRTIAAALDDRSPQFVRVTVTDPPISLPSLWRRVFEQLGAVIEPTDQTLAAELAPSHSDLGRLQRWIGGGAAPVFHGDGSLCVVRSHSEATLAHAAAQWCGVGAPSSVVVDGGNARLLDGALARLDQPAAGATAASVHRAIPQVLPLALRLLWQPLDPQHLLEFLMHPVCPVTGWLRHRLAEAIQQAPGIGGPEWLAALERAQAAARRRHAADGDALAQALERIQAALTDWIELPRHDPFTGAPGSAVAEVCGRVARWAAGRAATAAADAHAGGLFQALAAIARELAEVTVGQPVLTKAQTDRLLRLLAGSGWEGAPQVAELHHLPTRRAGAIIEPAATVLWWNAAGTPAPTETPWTRTEREALQASGVELLSETDRLATAARLELRPLLAARERLVLFQPVQRAGEPVPEHPLVTRLRSLSDTARAATLFREVDREALDTSPCAPLAWSSLTVRPLPAPRRWWRLPQATAIPFRPNESYTGLEKFVLNPVDWVLEHGARLAAGPLADASVIPDQRLFGNLLHRLTERMFDPGAPFARATANDAELNTWLSAQWVTLLPQEGATLLLPGRQSELARLQETAQRSLGCLLDTLRQMGAASVEANHQPKPKDFAALPDGTTAQLRGHIDLLVRNAAGDPVVFDLKWGGERKRRAELKQNRALQLAVYAFLVGRPKALPPGAFLILKRSAWLTDAPGLIPGTRPVESATGRSGTRACWDDFLSVWRWRREQLAAGWIEVANVVADPEPGAAPAEVLPPCPNWLPTKDDEVGKYSPYRALLGWGVDQ